MKRLVIFTWLLSGFLFAQSKKDLTQKIEMLDSLIQRQQKQLTKLEKTNAELKAKMLDDSVESRKRQNLQDSLIVGLKNEILNLKKALSETKSTNLQVTEENRHLSAKNKQLLKMNDSLKKTNSFDLTNYIQVEYERDIKGDCACKECCTPKTVSEVYDSPYGDKYKDVQRPCGECCFCNPKKYAKKQKYLVWQKIR